ncbi:MAG TPA: triose-phosphate isomerase [Gemmatimonadales bacterium]|nr:triose-phosphate isomerase [Gemmatimonadales bacterium]
MRRRLYAANWKMHIGPADARRYVARFRELLPTEVAGDLALFPPAVSLEAAAAALEGDPRIQVGAQDVHWELKGAYTGAISVPLATEAGATMALVGHSERRHVFGETEPETARKLRAVLDGDLTPILCVGEKLDERERGETEAVVLRQLSGALEGISRERVGKVVVAYEPVWAIGTGRNATPADAAAVHRVLRTELAGRATAGNRILYGGSVNLANAAALLAEEEVDGVLVGGASLDPEGWAGIVAAGN